MLAQIPWLLLSYLGYVLAGLGFFLILGILLLGRKPQRKEINLEARKVRAIEAQTLAEQAARAERAAKRAENRS
jgi:hypothetical protein